MKRLIILFFVILPFALTSSTPASGVFGLGKCEKVLTKIKSEVEIDHALTVNLNKLVPGLRDTNSYTKDREHEWWGIWITTLESRIRSLKYISTSTTCFTVDAQVQSRNAITTYNNMLRTARANFKDYSNNYGFDWKKMDYVQTYQYAKENRR